MPSIRVQYFAMLREKAGVDSEVFAGDFKTHSELYELLDKKYHFDLPAKMVQVAANDEFTSMASLVVQDSTVVFIPPVAGG
jgi:molybdopterin synthase sulfur carrier subunit